MSNTINILDLCSLSKDALGPGNRYIIWTQGCPFKCKGCTSPESIPIKPNKIVETNFIVDSILNNKEITGITISGGEPFLQASKLANILKEVNKFRKDLNVIVFTGFLFEKLDWTEAKEFIQYIDLLIDGPYIEKYNNNKGLRGSTNQRFIFLSEKLKEFKNELEIQKRKLTIVYKENSEILIGIPEK